MIWSNLICKNIYEGVKLESIPEDIKCKTNKYMCCNAL